MNREQFWKIIEESRRNFRSERADGNMDGQIDALRDNLLQLPPTDVQEFARLLHGYMVDAYRWDLWGAAAALNHGSCSDDSFTDFCGWLISMGMHTYDEALSRPDSLAEVVKDPTVEDFFFEEFQSIPGEVYKERTGEELPDDPVQYPDEPRGEKLWETPDDLQRQYPQISAAVPSNP